jgi:hypothetical protein
MDSQNQTGEKSVNKTKSKPKCFRILDIPDGWDMKDLKKTLETLDSSLSSRKYDLSLYPACHGMGQVAILKLNEGTEYFDRIVPGKAFHIEGEELAIDCDFEGLTPLNSPSEEINAE